MARQRRRRASEGAEIPAFQILGFNSLLSMPIFNNKKAPEGAFLISVNYISLDRPNLK
jgi:hypothetical protein